MRRSPQERSLLCQRPLTCLLSQHPHPTHGSLGNNRLCGLYYEYGALKGTYTAEGITKLCEGLKGSAVTSLKCATAPECLLLCQRPLTSLSLSWVGDSIDHEEKQTPLCPQAPRQQARTRRRSRARGGPQRQLNPAVAGVGCSILEPRP